MIYLDNASTTKIDQEVLEEMLPYLMEEYGNPGTVYGLGRSAAKAVEKARQRVADFLNCRPEQVLFTSGGSEANNTVMNIAGSIINEYAHSKMPDFYRDDMYVVTDTTEHDSILESIRARARVMSSDPEEDDNRYLLLEPDSKGHISAREVEKAIDDGRAALVSVMYVNNETGAVNPIEEISGVCARENVLFHTDCTQAAGCFDIDVRKIGCDFATVSSHKIHGPKGVGALYHKNPVPHPLIYGGKHQEFGQRGGTENVAGIVGFGKACELAMENLKENANKVSLLKQEFYNALMQASGEDSEFIHVNGEKIIHPGKVVSLRFDGVDAQTLVLLLDTNGVCVSAGSACRSHETTASRTLLAMGLTEEQARSTIRVSFSHMNTEEQAVQAAKIIAQSVAALRGGCV